MNRPDPSGNALPPRARHSDPWRELGLAPGAEEDEIQRAYRKAVRRYPPELAAERFARIQEAYDTLRSPGKLLAEARDRPTATLERLFPVDGLGLGAEPKPPLANEDEFEDLMSLARRAAVLELLRSLGGKDGPDRLHP